MGSYEIFDKSSDDSIQDVVEVDTPSPLTSSHSSDSCRSLLIGINELTSGLSTHREKKLDDSSSEEAEVEKYSKPIGSTERFSENFHKKEPNEESLSDFDSISLESSPSSLKRRLRNLPSPSDAIGLADRVAVLDRRIRQERDVYLQLQGLTDRIDEKDELETSSLTDSASIPKLLFENHSHPTLQDARSLQKTNMCSSAPETMRLKNESFDQTLPDVATRFKTPLGKNFDDRRPPKYLQPLEAPTKEILRCNAPPLCLSDKKIAELLRRGSLSAREEFLKKSSKAPTKLAGYRKPTGMIIKNLSSGSEEDCSNQWLIRDSSVTKFESEALGPDNLTFRSHKLDDQMKLSIPEETSMEKTKISDQQIEHREKSESCDHPRSSETAKTAQQASANGDAQLNKNTEVPDDLPSSRSSRFMKTSLQNSTTQMKSVRNDSNSNSRDSHPFNVPKLEIQSQDYSQSTSHASREDSTKRSLDIGALIRALSDVSIKQQEFVDRKVESGVCDSVVSRSTKPKSLSYASVVNGSRQSIISTENKFYEAKRNYLRAVHLHGDTIADDKKITCIDGNSNALSKIPIVTKETNDVTVSKANHTELRKTTRKNIATEEYDVPQRQQSTKITVTGFSTTKKSSKCRSTNFIDANKSSVKLQKITSPEMINSRKPKYPRISRTAATTEEKSFRITKNNFQSFDSLLPNREKLDENQKVTAAPAVVLSEPGTSRNGRPLRENDLSSRGISGIRDILPRVSIDDHEPSDDRLKYLQRGNKKPYNRSSSGSCDSSKKHEETEFKLKMISPSATGSQSADQFKSEAKFKIYEDTIEGSPRHDVTFPVEKLNTLESSSPRTSKSRRQHHGSDSKCTHVNGLSVLKDSKPNVSSPEDCHDYKTLSKNDKENTKNFQKMSESRNIFWADSSAELNSAMNCSFESTIEMKNYSMIPDDRSFLISPANSSKKKSYCSSRSSPIIFSNKQPIGTESRGSPRRRYDEIPRRFGKDLETGLFEDFQGENERKFDEVNIFPSSVVAKRLSYSELQNSHSKNDNNDENLMPERENSRRDHLETSSPEELIESNTSQTNLAITGRSEGTVHQYKKAFDRVANREKMSSSLSKLCRSPIETNIASRRKSQERFPFTISESTSAKSSSKFRVENTILVNSDCMAVDPSETAYKLRVHPSLLRLASAGVEVTPEEIIRSASIDTIIRVERRNFVTKLIGRFSSKLKKSKNCEEKPGSGTTKVLYENKKCRAGSAEESSGSDDVTEKSGRRFNRDGLWVEGLRGEIFPDSEAEKNQCHGSEEFPDATKQNSIDRYTNFLAKRERLQRQFYSHSFAPKTPMNSLIINEDSDTDSGCFCVKICRFLIGGKFHSHKRSSLFLRARRSKFRKRFL